MSDKDPNMTTLVVQCSKAEKKAYIKAANAEGMKLVEWVTAVLDRAHLEDYSEGKFLWTTKIIHPGFDPIDYVLDDDLVEAALKLNIESLSILMDEILHGRGLPVLAKLGELYKDDRLAANAYLDFLRDAEKTEEWLELKGINHEELAYMEEVITPTDDESAINALLLMLKRHRQTPS